MPTRGENGPDDNLRILAFREILQHEIDFRRERRWGIFTWASTLLVAVIGGTVALQQQSGVALGPGQKILLSAAVVILAGYSCIWWESHRRVGSAIRKQLFELDRSLGLEWARTPTGLPRRVGGFYTILLLAIAAVAAIWLPPS